MLKCNQNDLKRCLNKKSDCRVSLDCMKPNGGKNPPKSHLLSGVSAPLRSAWHSPYSVTFVVRKHELRRRKSMTVTGYWWEAVALVLLKSSWGWKRLELWLEKVEQTKKHAIGFKWNVLWNMNISISCLKTIVQNLWRKVLWKQHKQLSYLSWIILEWPQFGETENSNWTDKLIAN